MKYSVTIVTITINKKTFRFTASMTWHFIFLLLFFIACLVHLNCEVSDMINFDSNKSCTTARTRVVFPAPRKQAARIMKYMGTVFKGTAVFFYIIETNSTFLSLTSHSFLSCVLYISPSMNKRDY